jgi:hypothetical protein
MMSLSRCESMANNFDLAIKLLQSAQTVGGDYDFWQGEIT